jgi:hypothetical protein
MPATLLFTLLCDDVREEKSGKLSLIGLYNYTITFQTPPSQERQAGVPIRFVLPQLCVLHRWGAGAAGQKSITEIVDPSGATRARAEVPLQNYTGDGCAQEIIRFMGVILDEGIYLIRTSCDGSIFNDHFEVKYQEIQGNSR